jgi:hypothetical protein
MVLANRTVDSLRDRTQGSRIILRRWQRSCHRRGSITVGADKAYDTKDFVTTVRELNVTPHVRHPRRQ